ncbi:hypothetical protein HOA92_07025 [archaeon]|jgi:hypothetical protein|nr:hypothetical protein [archaeon]MBT6762765.1 hypothetical protein [archaeon]
MKLLKEYSNYCKEASKEVFANKNAVLAIIGLSGFFILFNLIFREYLLIRGLLFQTWIGFIDGVWYAWMTMPIFAKFLMVIISILSAMLMVFVYVGYKKNQSLTGGAGSGGIVLGLLAPACPSCGIGALSLMGFGGLGALLPFGGREIGFIAIFVLLGSLMYVSREIVAPRCRIK